MNASCKRFFGTMLLILACFVMKPNPAAAQTPSPVVVTNATTKPVPTKDVDNAGRAPFTLACSTTSFTLAAQAACSLGTVPTGKRFVIEMVDGKFTLATGTKPVSVGLQVVTAGTIRGHFFPATFLGNSVFFNRDFFVVNQPVRLYADAGTSPSFNVTISNTTSGQVGLSASGYLVTIP